MSPLVWDAQTHTVVLPQAMAYNAPYAPAAMQRIADVLGVDDAPSGVFSLIADAGGPTSLRELGMAEAELDRAAELAGQTPYPNPAPLSRRTFEGCWVALGRGKNPTPELRAGAGRSIPPIRTPRPESRRSRAHDVRELVRRRGPVAL